MNLAVRRQLQLDRAFAENFKGENAQHEAHRLVNEVHGLLFAEPIHTEQSPQAAKAAKVTAKKANDSYDSKTILLAGAALVAVLMFAKQ